MKFKEYIKETSGKQVIMFYKKKYDWGILRRIEVGRSFSIIIHPENWDIIQECLRNGKTKKFKDEQGYTWIVSCDEYNITFKSGAKNVRIEKDMLMGKLK
jgi:hypothetical protein